MPAVVALLFLIASGFAAPLAACGAGGASTFCADGWVTAPLARDRAGQDGGDDVAVEGAEIPVAGDDIYVEGAVPVDAAPPGDESL